jgi:hypothetical protein
MCENIAQKEIYIVRYEFIMLVFRITVNRTQITAFSMIILTQAQ